MIRYELTCDKGDRFEAWFGNSADYDRQADAGLVECPHCGSKKIAKAPMAPAIIRGRKKNEAEARRVAMAVAEEVREHIRTKYDYVGEKFPEEARKIHEGEAEHRLIWGEATPEEAREMAEEGMAVAPLPAELAPAAPKKLN
ncbi:MAG: DUF1178 family protein [Hyphomonadaceae bacterium]